MKWIEDYNTASCRTLDMKAISLTLKEYIIDMEQVKT